MGFTRIPHNLIAVRRSSGFHLVNTATGERLAHVRTENFKTPEYAAIFAVTLQHVYNAMDERLRHKTGGTSGRCEFCPPEGDTCRLCAPLDGDIGMWRDNSPTTIADTLRDVRGIVADSPDVNPGDLRRLFIAEAIFSSYGAPDDSSNARASSNDRGTSSPAPPRV